jgi:hypothetical protein
MERFKAWLGEGLILVPTVLLLGLLLYSLAFRYGSLGNIAELLPAETDAFFIVNREDYKASGEPIRSEFMSEFLGTPLDELTWLGRDLGVAWVDGSVVEFLETTVQGEAEDFFAGLVEGGELTPSILDKDIQCFKLEALCMQSQGRWFIFSSSEEALAAVAAAGPSLESTAKYQNVRSRLKQAASAFVYIDLTANIPEMGVQLRALGINEPLLLQSLLEIFPAWGASITMEPGAWFAESFLAVDKKKIRGAYFHPNKKYEQKFLPWTQNFAWEWGTTDLAAQIVRMEEIFTELGTAQQVIFGSSLDRQLRTHLGGADLTQVLTLLDKETYFGFTSWEDFLFILELEEGERAQAEALLANTGWPHSFTEDALIIAAREDLLTATLDKKNGLKEDRDLADISVLLPGSDEFWILNGAFFPEEHILMQRLSTLKSILSTRKAFDDGIFTRTSLLP